MRIAILNWANGENDPFSYFSRKWKERLCAVGHEVFIIALDDHAILSIASLHQEQPIDLAFCWQGLGSGLVPDGFTQSLWEVLRTPLVCLHGDHPCYNPFNHQQSSAYLIHIYGPASFAKAANTLIPRVYPAVQGLYPGLFELDEPCRDFVGDYFVLAKNIQHPSAIYAEWKARCTPETYALLTHIADQISHAFRQGNVANHHDVILDHAPANLREAMVDGRPESRAGDVLFLITRELDRIHRNVAATFVVDALPDVPLRVYGRGWEHFAARNNPNHQFLPAQSLEESAGHYRSQFGILDIAPANDMLHDRTFRALQIGGGFLISSAWHNVLPDPSEFAQLFFGGSVNELSTKVEAVMSNPAEHRRLCSSLGRAIQRGSVGPAQLIDAIQRILAERGVR